jgi:hypothetical protein
VPKPRGGFGYVLDLPRLAGNPNLIVPSKPDQSELWLLVRNGEMPPPDAPPLTAAEKEVIRAWIAAGAPVADSPAAPSASAPGEPEDEAVSEPASRPALGRTLLWLGKLHFLVLHFPIALLLAGCAGELWAAWTGARAPLPVVRFCTGLGAAAVLPTVALGWLYAQAGHGAGSPDLLGLHRWVGTAAGAWAVAAVLGSEWDARRGRRTWPVRALLLGGTLLVGTAAHLGGLLVHGRDFFGW